MKVVPIDDKQLELLHTYLSKYFTPSEIEELIEDTPLTGEHGLRRMLGEISPEYFCKAYIPTEFPQDFGDYAKEILSTLKDAVESNVQENIAVVCPRGHGKSTISSVGIPTWCTVYQRKKFILFISANGETAANFLKKIQVTLESPAIVEDFGPMRDKKKTWNADELQTTTNTWIGCTGWQSGLRGWNKADAGRPDLLILDDLEDKKVMESESMRRKLDEAFREEIGRLGNHRTDFFYIGTLLAQDALLARVIKEPSWKTMFYKRVLSFPENENLWEQWKLIYRNLENPNRMDDAYQFYLDNQEEMTRGAKVLWEGKTPSEEVKYQGAYYHVMLDREKWGENSFWKEDQNEPRSSQDFIFQDIKYWKSLPPLNDCYTILGVDPSMGGKNSDYSALCVMAKHKETGYKYVLDGQLHRMKPNELIKVIIQLCKQYDITNIGFESVNFQEYVADDLKRKLKEEELYHVIVKNVKPRSNKHNRIVNLEPFVSRGEVLFNENCTLFNRQVQDYNINAKNDDAPDVLQLSFELVEKIKKPKKIYDKPTGW